jgi:hypothetical protein
MQRAAANLGLDWMFVTAEVPVVRVDEAFHGIRALNFSGAAFLPPHRTAGARLVDSMTESAIRSGQVRVARRDGSSWLGEDTLGSAVVELIDHEELVLNRSEALVTSGREWLPHLIRLSASQELKEPLLVEMVENTASLDASPEASNASETESTLTIASKIARIRHDEFLSETNRIQVLIIDGEGQPPPARLLAKYHWSESPSIILVEPNPKWEQALSRLKLPHVRFFRTMDIVAAKATVNFQFWTGCRADLGQMRESLDEYCQW